MIPGDRPVQRLRTAAVRGVLWLGGEQISRRVMDQIFTIVLARLLLPKDFGVLALASVFTSLLRIFADMALGASLIQRREIDEEYLSTAFWANLGAGGLLTLISAAVAFPLGKLVGEPAVGPVLIFLSLRFVISAASATHYAVISRSMDYRALTLRDVTASVIGGLIGVGMAYRGLGVWSLVGQALVTTVVSTILIYYATGWKPKRIFSRAKFLELWSFGGRLQLSRLFNNLVRQSDNFLIGRFLGSTALGFYAMAYTIYLIPVNDVGLVNTVIFSGFSRLQDDSERFKRGFLLATRYVTIIGLPIMVGLSQVAPLLVEVFFGEKWLPAAPVVSILTMAGFLQLMLSLGPVSLQAAGRADLRLRLSSLSMMLYLPAFALGLRWGISGVAAGYLAATVIMTPVLYGYVARVVGITLREMWGAVFPSIIGCVVMASAVAPARWALGNVGSLPKVVVLALLVALGIVVYGIVAWLIQREAVLGLVRTIRDAISGSAGRRLKPAEEA